ncbi:hypothetical protein TNCV_276851 [Trichonephila clavipes]|uniref:Paired domain-containing protein n=1 Tax=Trichonephila clavipes TaxID=2585209 RepID=A0A8X6S980_TRICX|nr:hypothetical protein TNCV_276851 [Trichonephila clavipes]
MNVHLSFVKNLDYVCWCAKFKEEVEKLAYQLNEEAERTERPIRRLSKVMYGSTCADMQSPLVHNPPIVHSPGFFTNQQVSDTCTDGRAPSAHCRRFTAFEDNSPLCIRHLDAFTRGRIIGKLEEGRSVTSVAAEFGIAHSIVSRLWRQFQTTGTAMREFSSGRP